MENIIKFKTKEDAKIYIEKHNLFVPLSYSTFENAYCGTINGNNVCFLIKTVSRPDYINFGVIVETSDGQRYMGHSGCSSFPYDSKKIFNILAATIRTSTKTEYNEFSKVVSSFIKNNKPMSRIDMKEFCDKIDSEFYNDYCKIGIDNFSSESEELMKLVAQHIEFETC